MPAHKPLSTFRRSDSWQHVIRTVVMTEVRHPLSLRM